MKKLNYNSNSFKIIKAFFIAFLISNFIYISFFENLFLEFLSPFLAIYGLILLLRGDSKVYFYSGFFIGILWFWWIGLSSIYFNLTWIIPFEILAIALVYGILFRICYIFKFDLLRLAAIFCLSFVHPLGFDWLNFNVLTVYGTFDASYRGAICIFLIAYFYYEKYISRYYKMAIITFLFFIGMQYDDKESQELNLNYKLVNTNISQNQKHLAQNLQNYSDDVLNEVFKAITDKKELIIFPETSFVFDLKNDFNSMYYELLKELSNDITIVVGALSTQKDKVYNSTYIFKNKEVNIMHKHYLVPFSEEIPFLKDFFTKYLLPGFEGFAKGKELNQYELNGQIITNAICYEVTKEKIYKSSKIIIAISNNAWFKPSTQAILQKALIKFYASKYGVTVYHSTNAEETAVIKPKISLFKHYVLEPIKRLEKDINKDKKANNQNISKNIDSNKSQNKLERDANLSTKTVENNTSLSE